MEPEVQGTGHLDTTAPVIPHWLWARALVWGRLLPAAPGPCPASLSPHQHLPWVPPQPLPTQYPLVMWNRSLGPEGLWASVAPAKPLPPHAWSQPLGVPARGWGVGTPTGHHARRRGVGVPRTRRPGRSAAPGTEGREPWALFTGSIFTGAVSPSQAKPARDPPTPGVADLPLTLLLQQLLLDSVLDRAAFAFRAWLFLRKEVREREGLSVSLQREGASAAAQPAPAASGR